MIVDSGHRGKTGLEASVRRNYSPSDGDINFSHYRGDEDDSQGIAATKENY
jgi:hypothetical protein